MSLSVDRSAGVIGPVGWTAGRVGLPGAVEGRGGAVVGVCPLGVDGAVQAAPTRITPRATRRSRFPPRPRLGSGLREVMTPLRSPASSRSRAPDKSFMADSRRLVFRARLDWV